jgi:hypothetical protein
MEFVHLQQLILGLSQPTHNQYHPFMESYMYNHFTTFFIFSFSFTHPFDQINNNNIPSRICSLSFEVYLSMYICLVKKASKMEVVLGRLLELACLYYFLIMGQNDIE